MTESIYSISVFFIGDSYTQIMTAKHANINDKAILFWRYIPSIYTIY